MNTLRNPPSEARLGVDIGRVIIDGSSHPAGDDTAFFTGDEATMLATPEMAGGFEALARLSRAFDGRVWLVSKCGQRVQGRTLRWLEAHDFYDRTGVPAEHVRFCRVRAHKRRHCEELALTHFIDDRPDVHEAIRGTVRYHYIFGPQTGELPDYAVHTPTWPALERAITLP
jgi:hypothetical protein